MAEIKHLLHINASLTKVYQAITEEEGLKNWWTNQTILRFTHGNWRESTDFFASCNYHWGYYLRSLKLLLETGEGTPFQKSKES